MYPGARAQIIDADSQQQKLDLLMEEKSIVSQLFEPDTIDVCNSTLDQRHSVMNIHQSINQNEFI